MFKFTLSRNSVSSQNDPTQLVGYNYYLIGSQEGQVLKKELIHTTINSNNPLDLSYHDVFAKKLYDEFLEHHNQTEEERVKIRVFN